MSHDHDHDHDHAARARYDIGRACRRHTRPRARGAARREGRRRARRAATANRLARLPHAGRRRAPRRARLARRRLQAAPARGRAAGGARARPRPRPVTRRRRAREHRRRAPHGRLHALLLLPEGAPRPPPDWYKSLPYRSRAVSDPRGVLREFGLTLDDDVELRVVDSTADIRYLVSRSRPSGTEALDEDALAALVTRDSMIGVSQAREPA